MGGQDGRIRIATRGRIGRLCLLAGAVMVSAGVLVAAAPQPSEASRDGVGAARSASLAAPALPQWRPVPNPIESFAISLPSVPGLVAAYEAERTEDGVGRRDTLVLGTLQGDRPYVAITVHRRPDALPTLGDTARRLAGPGVPALGQATMLTAKFGPMAAAPFVTAGASARRCLAFDRYEASAAVAIDGVVCAPAGEALEATAVSCLVDRLDLVGGRSDPALRRYFAEAEARRDFCGAGDLRASGTGKAFVDRGATLPRLLGGGRLAAR